MATVNESCESVNSLTTTDVLVRPCPVCGAEVSIGFDGQFFIERHVIAATGLSCGGSYTEVAVTREELRNV